MAAFNVRAACGVEVREFLLLSDHGTADYLLYVDGRAVGVVEANPVDHTLAGAESKSGSTTRAYPTTCLATSVLCRSCTRAPVSRRGLPTGWIRDLAVGTYFPSIGQRTPETLVEWLGASIPSWDIGQRQAADRQASYTAPVQPASEA